MVRNQIEAEFYEQRRRRRKQFLEALERKKLKQTKKIKQPPASKPKVILRKSINRIDI